MDQDRIEQALRKGPPDEPEYAASVGRLLASSKAATGTPPARSTAVDGAFDSGVRRVRGARLRSADVVAWRLSAPIAAALVIMLAGVVLWWGQGPATSPAPPDLLGRIRAAGAIHVVVTSGAPQVPAIGGAYVGFDIDVANAIADQLGVQAEITPLTLDAMLAEAATWDLAFPTMDRAHAPSGFLGSDAYYAWPSWLVVASDSEVASFDDLAGTEICVVDGSAGENWLSGDLGGEPHPPASVTAARAADDAACFEAVVSGAATAAVTANTLDTELGAHGVRALTADPVFRQERVALIRAGATVADAASFVARLNEALAELRASGTLAELSQRAFGGRDLTESLP